MSGVPMSGDMVVLSKSEYERLVKDAEFLQNLLDAGVDNWEGYHYGFTGYDGAYF